MEEEKKVLDIEILNVHRKVTKEKLNDNTYMWGEVLKELSIGGVILQDTDTLLIGASDGEWHDGQHYEGNASIRVFRERLETDEELTERLDQNARYKLNSKERRLAQYEKLKKEFGDV